MRLWGRRRARRLSAAVTLLALALAAGLLSAGTDAPRAHAAETLLGRITVESSAMPRPPRPLGPTLIRERLGDMRVQQGLLYTLRIEGTLSTFLPDPRARAQVLDAFYCTPDFNVGSAYACPPSPTSPAYPQPVGLTLAASPSAVGQEVSGALLSTPGLRPAVYEPSHRYDLLWRATGSGELGLTIIPTAPLEQWYGDFTLTLFGEPAAGAPSPAPGAPAPTPPAPSRGPTPTKNARSWDVTYKVPAQPGDAIIVASPELDRRQTAVVVKLEREAEDLRLALALAQKQISEDQARALCVTRLKGVKVPTLSLYRPLSGGEKRDFLTDALQSCLERIKRALALATPKERSVRLGGNASLASQGGCGLTGEQLVVRRLPGRVRVDVLPPGTPGPRSQAKVTCTRSRDGRSIAIKVSSRSADTPLRDIVGERLPIGIVVPASAQPGGKSTIRFTRR